MFEVRRRHFKTRMWLNWKSVGEEYIDKYFKRLFRNPIQMKNRMMNERRETHNVCNDSIEYRLKPTNN